MVAYTKEDMKVLESMSEDGTFCREFMEDMNYDPQILHDHLDKHNLKKDIHYLFEVPLEEVPLLINRGEISGYLRFRLTVGK